MVFSSTVFLFIFLPLVLFINFLLRTEYRNFFLLLASLFFYAWGEGILVLLMIFSTCINYIAGIGISSVGSKRLVKWILGAAIAINLLFLFYYKYLDFLVNTFPFLDKWLTIDTHSIVLPIGISFYTFHAISYLVDIYRKNLPGIANPIDLGLYIAFFPQLVAGPIVRYSDISAQLQHRSIDIDLFFEGTVRFIRGLAKKIIVANTLGVFADQVFAVSPRDNPALVSWLGIICYSLQIYYDFSGYSDMAIGLAKMFGFTFKENFNYPYVATSIQDFWRRWHISLSSWFRDYLYISLGGNRKGEGRTYINLIIVFFLTGLWHGASWSFVVWGLFHGVFLILERRKIVPTEKMPAFLKHLYVIVVVMTGWVFFRSETLQQGLEFLVSMMGVYRGENYSALIGVNNYTVTVFLLALIFCAPVRVRLSNVALPFVRSRGWSLIGMCVFYMILFFWSVSELAQASYNPFIYFRF